MVCFNVGPEVCCHIFEDFASYDCYCLVSVAVLCEQTKEQFCSTKYIPTDSLCQLLPS